MKVLIFTHPEFIAATTQAREWIRSYADALAGTGCSVKQFDSLSDKVAEADWVQVFSREDPETWHSMRSFGARVAVLPSLEPGGPRLPGPLEKGFAAAASLARAAIQRRWPPIEERGFYRANSHVFVVSESWRRFVREAWRIEPARVSVIPEEPAGAAAAVGRFFLSEACSGLP